MSRQVQGSNDCLQLPLIKEAADHDDQNNSSKSIKIYHKTTKFQDKVDIDHNCSPKININYPLIKEALS